jgi:hypothetical protein
VLNSLGVKLSVSTNDEASMSTVEDLAWRE